MMTFAVLVVLCTCTAEVVLGQLSLDMAQESVDDQYNGCKEKMLPLVYKSLEQKQNSDEDFQKAWTNGRHKSIHGNELGLNSSIALYVYTDSGDHGPPIYKMFNDASRTGKNSYKAGSYQWYFLHYWLTVAIQDLKKRQTSCLKTYRGTKLHFTKNINNTYIRLGSFASSSPDPKQAEKFGKRSCFEIYTCLGAKITQYSANPDNSEVLIPPYETFNVTVFENDPWCETVYKLVSVNATSDLNCFIATRELNCSVAAGRWTSHFNCAAGAGRSMIDHIYPSLWVASLSVMTVIHRVY